MDDVFDALSGKALLIALGVFLSVALVFGLVYRSSEHELSSVTIESKERVCEKGNSECRYLLFTDHGTLQVTDSVMFWRFDSSDVYGKIKSEQRYDLDVAGWRIPALSRYQNVLSATPAK